MNHDATSAYNDIHMSGGSAVLGNVYHQHTYMVRDQPYITGGPAQRSLEYAQFEPLNARQRLLENLYFDTFASRKAAIHAADQRTCEWLWNTNFATWVRNPDPESNIFWICGKPGSGKSTLMKFLTQERKLERELPDTDWITVHFFFDFRQKDRVGNSYEGLLRSLLVQIIELIPQLPSSILQQASRARELTCGTLHDLFKLIFQVNRSRLFCMIDGLDEYEGNMQQLLNFLMMHSRDSKVRILLASRPHTIIEAMVSTSRLIMSEHNSEGIRNYVKMAIINFKDLDRELEWQSLCQQLEDRADGVFLWVHLVLEEVLQAVVYGNSFHTIMKLLDSIPAELDAFYQRMFDAIPGDRELETAIVYAIVARSELQLTVAQLHGMILFINEQYELNMNIETVTGQDQFLRRIVSLGGGLFHLRRQEPCILGEGLYTRDCIDYAERFGLKEYGKGITIISIMHKTVTAFVERSRWVKTRLPRKTADIMSGLLCRNIGVEALKFAETRLQHHIGEISGWANRGKFYSGEEFRKAIEDMTRDKFLSAIAPLIHFVVRYMIPEYLEAIKMVRNSVLAQRIETLLQSRLAPLHFVFSWTHFCLMEVPQNNLSENSIGDLILAAEHGYDAYIDRNLERITNLYDAERDAVLVQLMDSVDPYRCGCERERVQMDYSLIRDVIKKILSQPQRLTELRVGLCLLLGDLKPLVDRWSYTDLQQSISLQNVSLPPCSQELKVFLYGRDVFAIWVCMDEVYNKEACIDYKQLLSDLLSLGYNIKARNASGLNIIQYLIEIHLLSHLLRARAEEGDVESEDCHYSLFSLNVSKVHDLLDKIYILEEFGADFSAVKDSQTLLQAFRQGRRRLFRILDGHIHAIAENENYIHSDGLLQTVMVVLDEFGFILDHKESHGHLPQPMLQRYDLEHYYCRERKGCSACTGSDQDQSSGTELCQECNNEDMDSDE